MYDIHVAQVFSYLRRRCNDRSTAEDLTSETFASALHSLRRRPSDTPDLAWLVGIARHKLIDHWRRVEREERRLRAVVESDVDHDRVWETELDSDRAASVLAGLAAHYRLALTLRYLDDLPVPQIAVLLDRGVHSTESLLARARNAFRVAYIESEAGRHAI